MTKINSNISESIQLNQIYTQNRLIKLKSQHFRENNINHEVFHKTHFLYVWKMNENVKIASVKTAPIKKLQALWSLYRHKAESFIGFQRAFFVAFL